MILNFIQVHRLIMCQLQHLVEVLLILPSSMANSFYVSI